MRVSQDSTAFSPVIITLETEEEHNMFKSLLQAVTLNSLFNRNFNERPYDEAKKIYGFGVKLFSKLMGKDDWDEFKFE